MTVQELINKLNQIEDKTKEVKYAELYSTDSLGNHYCTYKCNKVTINSDEVWIEYN